MHFYTKQKKIEKKKLFTFLLWWNEEKSWDNFCKSKLIDQAGNVGIKDRAGQ